VYNAIKKLARALRSREPPRNIIKKIGTSVASKKIKNPNRSKMLNAHNKPHCIKKSNSNISYKLYFP
jgi:hypothetical protein